MHFTNPITIDQAGNPNWKIGTPDDVLLRYRNTYYMILQNYDYCKAHYGK
ncbi:MAG: hypothetical protein PARBB_01647 [Parabacteroides distasonis]